MSVVDVAFWAAIFTAGMGLRVSTDSRIADKEWAASVGEELAYLNYAVAQRLSNSPELADGVYTDWREFHPAMCGGTSAIEALPCHVKFDGTGLSGLFRDIAVSTSLNDEGMAVRMATISLNPARKSQFSDPDRALAGTIASSAGASLPSIKNSIDYAFRWNASVDPATAEVRTSINLASANSIWVSAVGDTTMHGDLVFELGAGGTPAYDLMEVRSVGASRLVDWENGGYFLDGVSAAVMDLETNELSAPRLVDADDSGFALDPAGASHFNRLEVGAIRINLRGQQGAACNAEQSLFARDIHDNLLVCESNAWARPGDDLPRGAIFAFDRDKCPENEGFIDITDVLSGAAGRVIVGVNRAFTGEATPDFAPYNLGELSGSHEVRFAFEHFPMGRMILEGSDRSIKERFSDTVIDYAGENSDDLNIHYRVGRTVGTGQPADIRTAYQEVLMCLKQWGGS